MDLPENYKSEYRHRVYHPNHCNKCFSKVKLKKCAACLAVSYCCRDHQVLDWSFHRPTCIALKKIKETVNPPEKLTKKNFYLYRSKLACELAKLRNMKNVNFLTIYEQQICMIPWVCNVCFVTPTDKYECGYCKCVVYCSREHKNLDQEDHKAYCELWSFSLISHKHFENMTAEAIEAFSYKPILGSVRQWPLVLKDFRKLIMNGIHVDGGTSGFDIFRTYLFMEQYYPAAIIITYLEAIFIKKRKLVRGMKQKVADEKTMTIHFGVADGSELSLHWDKIATLLTNWIKNITKIKVILTGSMLENLDIPEFPVQNNLVVSVIPKDYHKCKDLPMPDLMVLMECYRAELTDGKRINEEMMAALLKFPEVPVLIFDSRFEVINELYNNCKNRYGDEITIASPTVNAFAQVRKKRMWTKTRYALEIDRYGFYMYKNLS